MCRLGATAYDENLGSWLYPGNTLSQQVLREGIWQLESLLDLGWYERQQVTLRMDAGFGTDAHLEWLLHQGYQLLAKSHSGRRAGAWGARVQQWIPLERERRWVALPSEQLTFCRPTRTLAVRWLDRHGEAKHALYVVTDLQRPIEELILDYDLRAGLEVDIREDKQGLFLARRRKHCFYAQEMLALLTDLAHNLLVALRRLLLTDTPLANFGIYRLVQEVLSVPGYAQLDEHGFVTELKLLKSHPHAPILAEVLPRLWR